MKRILIMGLVVSVLLLILGAIGCKAPYDLSPLEVSPAVCLPGDKVTISTTVDYKGSEEYSYAADFLVNGVVEQTQNFTFEPNSSQLISFTVSKDEPGRYEVQLGELTSSFVVLGVSNFEVSPSNVYEGQPVTVTADLRNVAVTPVTYCCCLKCGGEEVKTRDITIAGSTTETVTFTLSKDTGGKYEVELLGHSYDLIVKKPANFVVTGLSISPNPVKAGKEATVTALVSNLGDIAGTYDLRLLLDGAVYHTASIELAAHDNYEVSMEVSRDSAGSYTVAIGDKKETLEVIEPVSRESSVLYREITGDSELRVINLLEYDIATILCSADEPLTPLLAYYVQSEDTVYSQNVRGGTYYFYVTTGWGWDEGAKKFLADTRYYRTRYALDWTETRTSYTRWTFTFRSMPSSEYFKELDESEFPKLP